jgi:hypothetical protein
MTEAKKKRGRPPLFGRPMTGLERQHRYLAARSKRAREAAPDQFPGIMTGGEMLALLGHDFPTMTDAQVAALRAQGTDPLEAEDRDGQPPVDEFGEPLDSPDSTLPAGGPNPAR